MTDGADEADEVDERTIRVRRPAAAALDGLIAGAGPDERTLIGSRVRRGDPPDDATLRSVREGGPRHPVIVRATPLSPSVPSPPAPEQAPLTRRAPPVLPEGRPASGGQPPVDGAAIELAVRRTARRRALGVLVVAVAVAAASAILLAALLTLS